MNPLFSFYLSLGVLLFAVVTAVYFFQEWYVHHQHHPFFLYWAVGSLLLYLLQVPVILANLGVNFSLSQFSGFYGLTIPLSFGGFLLIYLGTLQASGRPFTAQQRLWATLWFAACLVASAYFFVLKRGELTSHFAFHLSNFGFFLPVYLLQAVAAARWFVALKGRGASARVGVGLLALAGLVAIVARGLLFARVLAYPPNLWFFAIVDFESLFLMRLLGLALLLMSFLFIHHSWHRGGVIIDHPYTLPPRA